MCGFPLGTVELIHFIAKQMAKTFFVFYFIIWSVSLLLLANGASAQQVNILPPQVGTTTLSKLRDSLAKEELTLPLRFSSQSPNTLLYTLVIPFTVRHPREGYGYNAVGVALQFLVPSSTGGFDGDPEVRIFSTIPFQVDRPIESTSTFEAKVSAALSQLSADINAGYGISEQYTKLYRTVTVALTENFEVTWSFTGLKNEKIPYGTYFVVAIVEVPASQPIRTVLISQICAAYRVRFWGLIQEREFCEAHPQGQWLGEISPSRVTKIP